MKGKNEVLEFLHSERLGTRVPVSQDSGRRVMEVVRVSGEHSLVVCEICPKKEMKVVYDPNVQLGMIKEFVAEFQSEVNVVDAEAEKVWAQEISEAIENWDNMPEELKGIIEKPEPVKKKANARGKKKGGR